MQYYLGMFETTYQKQIEWTNQTNQNDQWMPSAKKTFETWSGDEVDNQATHTRSIKLVVVLDRLFYVH